MNADFDFNHDIPIDIIRIILLKLDRKSQTLVRRVCSEWNNIISDTIKHVIDEDETQKYIKEWIKCQDHLSLTFNMSYVRKNINKYLYCACKYYTGDMTIIRQLVNIGKEINKDCYWPINWNQGLYGAVKNNNLNLVKLMIDNDAKNIKKATLLACKYADIDMIRYLKSVADASCVKFVSGGKMFMKACASKTDNIDLVKLFVLDREFNIEKYTHEYDRTKYVGFEYALRHGNIKIINFLWNKYNFELNRIPCFILSACRCKYNDPDKLLYIINLLLDTFNLYDNNDLIKFSSDINIPLTFNHRIKIIKHMCKKCKDVDVCIQIIQLISDKFNFEKHCEHLRIVDIEKILRKAVYSVSSYRTLKILKYIMSDEFPMMRYINNKIKLGIINTNIKNELIGVAFSGACSVVGNPISYLKELIKQDQWDVIDYNKSLICACRWGCVDYIKFIIDIMHQKNIEYNIGEIVEVSCYNKNNVNVLKYIINFCNKSKLLSNVSRYLDYTIQNEIISNNVYINKNIKALKLINKYINFKINRYNKNLLYKVCYSELDDIFDYVLNNYIVKIRDKALYKQMLNNGLRGAIKSKNMNMIQKLIRFGATDIDALYKKRIDYRACMKRLLNH